jgi:dTDP-4-dehydrorhamnose reductase
MTRTLILGGSGQIGTTLHKKLNKGHPTYVTNSQSLELGKQDDFEKLQGLIHEIKPQLIINCIGIFNGNDGDLEQLFNVNVRPSWYIIKIIQELSAEYRIDYSVLGSSAHREGKKDYFLYSASKAALSNLIEGASLSALDPRIAI